MAETLDLWMSIFSMTRDKHCSMHNASYKTSDNIKPRTKAEEELMVLVDAKKDTSIQKQRDAVRSVCPNKSDFWNANLNC